MIFQNVKSLLNHDDDFIHPLEICLRFLALQVAFSLINSSLIYQILSAAFALFSSEHLI